jgi:hypothetical protein
MFWKQWRGGGAGLFSKPHILTDVYHVVWNQNFTLSLAVSANPKAAWAEYPADSLEIFLPQTIRLSFLYL